MDDVKCEVNGWFNGIVEYDGYRDPYIHLYPDGTYKGDAVPVYVPGGIERALFKASAGHLIISGLLEFDPCQSDSGHMMVRVVAEGVKGDGFYAEDVDEE